PPLSVREARRLLDAQPHPPRGYAREQVLAQATGNPLALIELSKVIAADPAAGRRWMAEPLPLTDRLTAVMAAQFGVLPPSARAALLLAAVADSPDLTARVPGLDADALAPAERAGLIRVDGSGHSSPTHWYGPACTTPSRSPNAPPRIGGSRRRCTTSRTGMPGTWRRRRWNPTSGSPRRWRRPPRSRGAAAAAARALERAAELSPAEADQTRRLLAAAGLAQTAGQADWVLDLAARVLALTVDPRLR